MSKKEISNYKNYQNAISNFIDNRKSEMTEKLSELIRMPGVKTTAKDKMPYGEEVFKTLKFSENMIRNMGFKVERFNNSLSAVSLDDKPKELGILCHLDVVDASPEGWDTLPFEPVIKDNMIYGRGAYDNKGAFIAALYGLYAVKELNIPLKYGVGLYMGTDEESGGEDLEKFTKENSLPPKVFVPDSHFPVGISERGIIQLSGSTKVVSDKVIYVHSGQQINSIPETAEVKIKLDIKDCNKKSKAISIEQTEQINEIKEILNGIDGIKYEVAVDSNDTSIVNVKIFGQSSHVSRPHTGINAATAALRLMEQTDKAAFEEMSKLFPHNIFYGEGFGFGKENLTLSFTVLDYDKGELKFKTDSRVNLTESSREAADKIISKLPGDTKVVRLDEPHSVSPDSEIVKDLLSVYKNHTGRDDEVYGMSGVTYAHNIPGAVVFGAVIPEDGSGGAHGANERFNLDTMTKAAKIYADAIVKTVGLKQD